MQVDDGLVDAIASALRTAGGGLTAQSIPRFGVAAFPC